MPLVVLASRSPRPGSRVADLVAPVLAKRGDSSGTARDADPRPHSTVEELAPMLSKSLGSWLDEDLRAAAFASYAVRSCRQHLQHLHLPADCADGPFGAGHPWSGATGPGSGRQARVRDWLADQLGRPLRPPSTGHRSHQHSVMFRGVAINRSPLRGSPCARSLDAQDQPRSIWSKRASDSEAGDQGGAATTTVRSSGCSVP
jgi:hypothetical protein